MSDPMKSAWDDVAESFSALGRAMKDRYASGPGAPPEEGAATAAEDTERGGDPSAALREAFEQLLAAGRQFGDRAAGLVRDDEVKAQAKQVATTLNGALERTVDQLGQEVRGFFKGRRGEDGSIDADEHSDADRDAPATGEVTPPPGSAEGDTIP